MSVDFKLEGMDDFMRNLDVLKDRKSVNKRARAAARKAMQLVQFAAKVGASRIDDPVTRENITENIVIRNGKSRDLNTVRMRVGVLGGAAVNAKTDREKLAALPGGETVYWRYIEFGTSKVPATPFMRPALAENIQVVTDEFNRHFMKSIENAIKKGKIT
ncbi:MULTISPECIES: HK97-gp10 family putative phage morphogenesis protein [unclassified Acinetobacter]|uniref:HK97-gp10 family putative phage morphogenesis protein n=1 Tax=unclassified Acinetobacter TaxID=196816 RepID=UPI0015D13431|nr:MULTISPECIES: HK97-gp10 family putative phage morphogenesis protein [unclassified Acinetobacter]